MLLARVGMSPRRRRRAWSWWPTRSRTCRRRRGAHWCGGDCGEAADRVARTGRSPALSARFGPDPAGWRWGRAHQAVFAHPVLRGIPVLDRFGVARIAGPGDDTTLFRARHGGTRFHRRAWRFVSRRLRSRRSRPQPVHGGARAVRQSREPRSPAISCSAGATARPSRSARSPRRIAPTITLTPAAP